VLTQELLREEPKLTQIAFGRLLDWLDDGEASDGARYLEIRRRLVSYFDRRNRAAAEELADETLNRIARTLETAGEINTRPPARYCYVVAKFVLLEDFRRERRHAALDVAWSSEAARAGRGERDAGYDAHEQCLACLDQCLERLKPAQRDLIVEYYADERRQKIERRRGLAGRLGISMNALGIRACRIRDTLMECVESCRGRAKDLPVDRPNRSNIDEG
jgi:DNA-directed RNA polymerase specialized sigma24 family protein